MRTRMIYERVISFFKRHETAEINLVITANFMMSFLHFTGYAEYLSIERTTISTWADNFLWSYVFGFTGIWLLFFRFPPKIIWGLWVSTATFAIWGLLELYVGLTASNPVSLLGPAFTLILAAPLSWVASENMMQKSEVIDATVNK